MNAAAEPTCMQTGRHGATAFVEFQVSPTRTCGFPLGQLCHYTLEANPAAEGDGGPPERLTMGFPTADVVMVGARLGRIVEAIREQALAAVLPLPDRYNQTLGKAPWVAAIAVTRIEKSGVAEPQKPAM